MRAIPIDVLKAFVAVVDQRGFTRAAEDLGRTQPTVSLQVKRLEELIEAPLFEKASRLALTPSGELCLTYGRKIIAEHDELLDMVTRQRAAADAIRLGMPSEFASLVVPHLANLAHRDGVAMNFEFMCETSETLLDRYRAHQLDVAVAVTGEDGARDSVAHWAMPMSWIAASNYRLPTSGPVQLITTPESSIYFRLAAAALHQAGRKFEVVCKSANLDVLRSAIDSGYGVSAIPRGLAPQGARFVPPSQISALPDVTLGLFAPKTTSANAGPLIERMIDLLGNSAAVGLN